MGRKRDVLLKKRKKNSKQKEEGETKMTCKKEQQHSTIIRSKMNQKNRRTYCVATCQFISFSKKLKDPSTYPPTPLFESLTKVFFFFFLPETNQGLKSLWHISHTHTTHSHSCGGSFKTKTKVNLTIRSIFFFFYWHSRLWRSLGTHHSAISGLVLHDGHFCFCFLFLTPPRISWNPFCR